MRNYYADLRLIPKDGDYSQITLKQIKKAYKSRALETHSDRLGSDAAFLVVNEAYVFLQDTQKRAELDQAIKEAPELFQEQEDVFVALETRTWETTASSSQESSVDNSERRLIFYNPPDAINISQLINYTQMSAASLLRLAGNNTTLGLAIISNAKLYHSLDPDQQAKLLFIVIAKIEAQRGQENKIILAHLAALSAQQFVSAGFSNSTAAIMILTRYPTNLPALIQEDYYQLAYQHKDFIPFLLQKYGRALTCFRLWSLRHKHSEVSVLEYLSDQQKQEQAALDKLYSWISAGFQVTISFEYYYKLFGEGLVALFYQLAIKRSQESNDGSLNRVCIANSVLRFLYKFSQAEQEKILADNLALLEQVFVVLQIALLYLEPIWFESGIRTDERERIVSAENLIKLALRSGNQADCFKYFLENPIPIDLFSEELQVQLIRLIYGYAFDESQVESNFLLDVKKNEERAVKYLKKSKALFFHLLKDKAFEELQHLPWGEILSEHVANFNAREVTQLPEQLKTIARALKEFSTYLAEVTITEKNYYKLIEITGFYSDKLLLLKTNSNAVKLDLLQRALTKNYNDEIGFFLKYHVRCLFSSADVEFGKNILSLLTPYLENNLLNTRELVRSSYADYPTSLNLLFHFIDLGFPQVERIFSGRFLEQVYQEINENGRRANYLFEGKLEWNDERRNVLKEFREILKNISNQPKKTDEVFANALELARNLGKKQGSELETYLQVVEHPFFLEKREKYAELLKALEPVQLRNSVEKNPDELLNTLLDLVLKSGLDAETLDLLKEKLRIIDTHFYAALVHQLLFNSDKSFDKSTEAELLKRWNKISSETDEIQLASEFIVVARTYISRTGNVLPGDKLLAIYEGLSDKAQPLINQYSLGEKLRKAQSLLRCFTGNTNYFNASVEENTPKKTFDFLVSLCTRSPLIACSDQSINKLYERLDFFVEDNTPEYSATQAFLKCIPFPNEFLICWFIRTALSNEIGVLNDAVTRLLEIQSLNDVADNTIILEKFIELVKQRKIKLEFVFPEDSQSTEFVLALQKKLAESIKQNSGVLELLDKDENDFLRTETPEQRLEIHQEIIRSYEDFGYPLIMVSKMTVPERANFILQKVEFFLPGREKDYNTP